VIALSAITVLAIEAEASDKVPQAITIYGDFVPDRCSVRRPLTDDVLQQEIRKPVKVQWHAGITISGALQEAHLRPLSDGATLDVYSGGKGITVVFKSLRRDKRADVGLTPGAAISYWALLL